MDQAAQMRVAIATDVIASIEARKVNVAKGYYLLVQDGADGYCRVEDVPKLIDGKTCQVCALGASFLASIGKSTTGTIPAVEFFSDADDDYSLLEEADMRDHLRQFFDDDQLIAIEDAFEGWQYQRWFESHPDAADRLMAIMKNVIANDGTFVP